ncbi:MAG: tRNA uracil 4-sulfurtransferase ThiI [Aestuariibacter sp.]
MNYIIKLHPEINVKSRDVRRRFTRLVESNARLIFEQNQIDIALRNFWDKLELRLKSDHPEKIALAEQLLQRIPGIEQFYRVIDFDFIDKEDIYTRVADNWGDKLAGKTFAVRVKRKGNHDFSSTDLARFIGGELFTRAATGGVNLKNPDVTIQLEVENNKVALVNQRFKGLGGMPLPTQEDVLSLMSGGFDSGVASFQMIRRGAKTHFCFFNLGGKEHEIGVQEVSHYLWKTYSPSHRVKFIAVDFEPIVADILQNVENSLMGVVLKRMMLRAAEIVADNLQINGLVTGECLGQVSSQTLSNLHVIDQVTQKIVLRPLICSDKSEIINIAREIGTEDFAASMPEYCGVISIKPNIKAPLERVLEEEAKCDLSLIEKVVREADVKDIKKLGEQAEHQVAAVEVSDSLPEDAVVLDIRSPVEAEHKPLDLGNRDVRHIPFYQLAGQSDSLQKEEQYYLYCDRGVMSRMQALILIEKGFPNIKVFRP